jgi:hypothetical protein
MFTYALFRIRITSLGLTFPLALIPALYVAYLIDNAIRSC